MTFTSMVALPGLESTSVVELPQPGRPALRLFLARFDALRFDTVAFTMAGIECPVAIRQSVRKRQAEFFFGRLAADAALREKGISRFVIGIGCDREPLWPGSMVGSISHTEGLAGAVVGPIESHVGLGIDLEHPALGDSVAALQTVALDADELACVMAGAVGVCAVRVTLAFSAKESFYKAAFELIRTFLDFDAVRIVAFNERTRTIILRITRYLHAKLPEEALCRVGFAFLSGGALVTWFDTCDVMLPSRSSLN